MAPYFTNDSCNPFLPRSSSCTLGNYISFAVNASSANDFRKTIDFVQKHNIRLTVRNTGHDYNAKSTGAGAVGIWTHNMKDMKIVDYHSAVYSGKAMKLGAGVQAIDAYQYAYDQGLVVVGGNCPTVGIAGGYTQGGGHSPLSSKYGMAADQALEWEVVTGTGVLLTASPTQNADLYWALSGGGGGTYGVVVSLTVKAHKDSMTSAANLTFSSSGITQESFWGVVETFQRSIPSIIDTGTYISFVVTSDSFTVSPMQGPGVPKSKMQQLLNATLSQLEDEKIKYTYNIGEFPTFYDSYKSYNPPWAVAQAQIGGRLIPRSLVETNAPALIEAERRIVGTVTGTILSGVCVNVSVPDPSVNSVQPYWRTSVCDFVLGTPYNYTDSVTNVKYANLMTNQLIPMLADLTPNGGAYINEADFQQPDFQKVFYGDNYPRLRAIKAKYDPNDIFYAITAVGSEGWYEDQGKGGRLCPVA
ncbi:MAG: hypothetical protein LQ350_000823 [Teloschistes chrysophthalmus]|nr:MAG: hypothetical protein LQ350_000823 [Niorma chrysophthalma]